MRTLSSHVPAAVPRRAVLCCAASPRYIKSARTQDVVQEASGPSVKLEIGQGTNQLPGGRRYTVDLLVTSQAGGQVSSSRETLTSVVDVPAC